MLACSAAIAEENPNHPQTAAPTIASANARAERSFDAFMYKNAAASVATNAATPIPSVWTLIVLSTISSVYRCGRFE